LEDELVYHHDIDRIKVDTYINIEALLIV